MYILGRGGGVQKDIVAGFRMGSLMMSLSTTENDLYIYIYKCVYVNLLAGLIAWLDWLVGFI